MLLEISEINSQQPENVSFLFSENLWESWKSLVTKYNGNNHISLFKKKHSCINSRTAAVISMKFWILFWTVEGTADLCNFTTIQSFENLVYCQEHQLLMGRDWVENNSSKVYVLSKREIKIFSILLIRWKKRCGYIFFFPEWLKSQPYVVLGSNCNLCVENDRN